ncbi:MAG: hypothetical protein M4579_004865 [Chaenotheca gracillima]|nr:MAG: hypothetical protein M4579_004865 [Chaenotheca gracillima]
MSSNVLIRFVASLCILLSSLQHVQVAAAGGLAGLQFKWREMAHSDLVPGQSIPASKINETINPENVTLPIDHFGKYPGTYENRFWVAEAGYKRGGPVFIYDVGEGDAEPTALTRLKNETSFFKQIVDEYGGIGIVWEHRYYGTSTPFNISLDTTPEQLQYLTTEQALADVPVFANNFSRKNFPDVDFSPKTTPWIFIGGSYPGMRAAFMRKFYPDTIYASYASSPPVEARVDMSVYFEPLYRALNAYGFGNCTKDITPALKYIDEKLGSSSSSAQLKEQFLGKGAANNSNEGFADGLTAIYNLYQSYGVDGGNTSLRYFCDWIATDPATNKTSGEEGWAASKGAKFTVDRWASWPGFVEVVNTNLYTNCAGPHPNSTVPADCNVDAPFTDPSAISWTWQYCTQWGYFQSANLGPNQIVSSWNSLKHQADICHRQFPTGAASGLLPDLPRVDKTNAHFGGWAIRPSNVYWSGGEFDPWRTLSPLSSEPFAPNYNLTQDIPACGVSTSEDELFAYVMPNAEHAFDFRTTFPGGAVSRKYFTDALTQWLPCFNKRF